MEQKITERNRRRAELTFSVLDAMEDLRDVWRSAIPLGELSEQASGQAKALISGARSALDNLEKLL